MSRERNAGHDAASLVARAGYWHLRDIKPASPDMYVGKVESTVLMMLFDIYGISPADIKDQGVRQGFMRASTAYNLQWRANDEVLDELRYTTGDRVTADELNSTSVWHKYAGQMVTGQQGIDAALASMKRVLPGNDRGSMARKEMLQRLLYAYTERVADTANNPAYGTGEILPYPTALQCKDDITGHLGWTGAMFYALLLNMNPDDRTLHFFAGLSTAMQFGDDLMDWRKDWKDRLARQAQTPDHVRPIENLVLATLVENRGEMDRCATLFDDPRQSVTLFKEHAPNSYALVRQRFQILMDKLPTLKNGTDERIKRIVEFTFDEMLPRAPETGWFARWAKY